MRIQNRTLYRLTCAFLCLAVLTLSLPAADRPARADSRQTFLLAQARQLALSNNDDISKTYNDILLKKMKYTEAVEAVKAKVKDLKSFRWSPLLSFKFPQQLDMKTEYDLTVKPLTLQIEISMLQHKLNNLQYTVLCNVNKDYLNVYVSQTKADFAQQQLDQAQKDLARNQARLLTGDATQADVDAMKKSVEKLTDDLTQHKRDFEAAKSALSDLTKLDVTTGYDFVSPMTDSAVPREQLEAITQYTLQNDQACYEAKTAASTALLNLNSYDSLMRQQYGSKMNAVEMYVSEVKQGQSVDYSAFQVKYKQMLTALDKPWKGSFSILFFSFPKEWLKGEISGTRYIEEDQYALYTSCQEYESAKKEQDSTEKATRDKINAGFEALVTARNAYCSLQDVEDAARTDLAKVQELNQLGKAEYSEVKDKQDGFDDAASEALDSLSAYDGLLLDFDCLTCGAVTRYLSGTDISAQASSGGNSFASTENTGKPMYYIYTDVSNLVFVFGLDIPKDFQPQITDYEIWYGGTKIGARTPVNKQIRHLAMDYQDSNTLTVRLYNGGTFVAECPVDTTVPRDVLPIQPAQGSNAAQEKKIGTYSVATSSRGSLSTSVLTLQPDSGLGATYYSFADSSGTKLSTGELCPVEKSFSYLTLLVKSLSDVTLTLYDGHQQILCHARLDEATQSLLSSDAK